MRFVVREITFPILGSLRTGREFYVEDTATGKEIHKTYAGANWLTRGAAERMAERLNEQEKGRVR